MRLAIFLAAILAACAPPGQDVYVVDGLDDPVPAGCCEPGDRLDIRGITLAECDQVGGRMVGAVCEGVDF